MTNETMKNLQTDREELVESIKSTEPKDIDRNSDEYHLMLAVQNYCLATLDLLAFSDLTKEIVLMCSNSLADLGFLLATKYKENKCIIHGLKLILSLLDSFKGLLKYLWFIGKLNVI